MCDTTTDREAAARQLAQDAQKVWRYLRPTEKDVFRREAEKRIDRGEEVRIHPTEDSTDAANYVGVAMRSRMDDIGLLVNVAARGFSDDDAEMEKEADAAEALGAGLDDGDPEEAAYVALCEMVLSVETVTTFEIVLGTGGPDDRLIVECEGVDGEAAGQPVTLYAIRRILYRYSWEGFGEVALVGEDFTAAAAFAQRVVPELSE